VAGVEAAAKTACAGGGGHKDGSAASWPGRGLWPASDRAGKVALWRAGLGAGRGRPGTWAWLVSGQRPRLVVAVVAGRRLWLAVAGWGRLWLVVVGRSLAMAGCGYGQCMGDGL
jgi:hypothetical protein